MGECGTVPQGGGRTRWQAGHQTCPAPLQRATPAPPRAGAPTRRCHPSKMR